MHQKSHRALLLGTMGLIAGTLLGLVSKKAVGGRTDDLYDPIFGIGKPINKFSIEESTASRNELTLVARTLRHFFLGQDPFAHLEEDERLLHSHRAARAVGGIGGTDWRPLVVTNRRVMWRHGAFPWFERNIDVPLDDIVAIDRGTPGDWVIAGSTTRFRLRLKNGKVVRFYWPGEEAELDTFLTTLRGMISKENQSGP